MPPKTLQTRAKLDKVIRELEQLASRLTEVREGMTAAEIADLPVSYEGMKDRSCDWLQRFAADAQMALSLAVAAKERSKDDSSPPPPRKR